MHHSQTTLLSIQPQCSWAYNLAESSCCKTCLHVHLEQPMHGMQISLSEIQIVIIPCEYMGYQVTIEGNINRSSQAVQGDQSLRTMIGSLGILPKPMVRAQEASKCRHHTDACVQGQDNAKGKHYGRQCG